MALEIQIHERGEVLIVECEGRFEAAAMVDAFRIALDAAGPSALQRLLFDCRKVTGVPTLTQRFEMGTQAAELYLKRQPATPLAVAMLVSSEFLDSNRFGQTVARNRGLMGVTTDSEDEALEFLKSGRVENEQMH